MGQHRFIMKGEFSIYGQRFPFDWSRSWCDTDGLGVDTGIIEFFRESYTTAREKDLEEEYEYEIKKEFESKEREERATLERLKRKYEPNA